MTEQKIDPWDVQGAVVDGVAQAIDYSKLIEMFGSVQIQDDLQIRLQNAINLVAERTGKPAPVLHHFIKRQVFFSHRDLNIILDRVEKNEPFYLYTGRGPSSESMHLGHMVPFIFCRWLQQAFRVPLVIQLTDDEKFLFKDNLELEQCHQYALDNCKDIIACGFDPELTFIFSDLDFVGGEFYRNIVRIQKCINVNQAKSAFGFDDSAAIGKVQFVAVQAAPAFCSTFPKIFGSRKDIPCLIPCAIDQDPYFRLTRDVSKRLSHPKPSLIHSKFFPSLMGPQSKMSASQPNTTIFMTDTASQVKKKVNKSFSGGQDTVEEQQRLGCKSLNQDVAYQYLTFFLEDDVELKDLGSQYEKGTLMSSQMKGRCVEVLQKFVEGFQERRAAVTDEVVADFMDQTKEFQYIKAFPEPVAKNKKKSKSKNTHL